MRRLLAPVLAGALLWPQGARGADPVVPLEAGEQAPHAGLLVVEERFLRYLETQAELEASRLRVAHRERLIAELGADCDRSWLERHAYVLGLGTGILGAVVLVWGAARVIEAR